MKFRLGPFPSLQNLFGFGLPEIVLALVNLKCTSRLGLSSLALANMITETLRLFSM